MWAGRDGVLRKSELGKVDGRLDFHPRGPTGSCLVPPTRTVRVDFHLALEGEVLEGRDPERETLCLLFLNGFPCGRW
jgi:hypothetical protein